MKRGAVQCFSARYTRALFAAMAFCAQFAARAEIAATNLVLTIDVTDYTNCVPVITATFPQGVADEVKIEAGKTLGGTFTNIASVVAPSSTNLVFTNFSARVAENLYYRIMATNSSGAVRSAATRYVRFRRLDRDPLSGATNLLDGGEYTYRGGNDNNTNNLYWHPFDGATNTYSYCNASTNKIGINFNGPRYIGGVRCYPGNVYAGWLDFGYLYASATAAAYSSNSYYTLTQNKVSGSVTGLSLYTNKKWWFAASTNLDTACQYCFLMPGNGVVAEVEIYGWNSADITNVYAAESVELALLPQTNLEYSVDNGATWVESCLGSFAYGTNLSVQARAKVFHTGPIAWSGLPVGAAVSNVNASLSIASFAAISATISASFDKSVKIYCATAGAAGGGDGQSWTSPMTLDAALTAASNNYAEVWLKAETFTRTAEPSEVTLDCLQPVIRGGFAGTEISADMRAPDARTVIDGNACQFTGIKFKSKGTPENSTVTVSFERMTFRNARRGLHSSAQTGGYGPRMSVADCEFIDNAFNCTSETGVNGSAIYMQVSGRSQNCTLTNCVFRGNSSSGTYMGQGAAIYMNRGLLTMAGCDFIGNGMKRLAGSASAIYLNAAPIRAKNCRFLGNLSRASNGKYGAAIYFTGTALPLTTSYFTNCLFAANQETDAEAGGAARTRGAGNGGVICLNGTTALAEKFTVDTCTFAYNISDEKASASALNVIKGMVDVRNSIFYGNAVSPSNTMPADISCASTASVAVDYTLFGGEGARYYSSDSSTFTLGGNCTYGDPKFLTGTDAFRSLAHIDGGAVLPVADGAYIATNDLGQALGWDFHLTSSASEISRAIDAGDPAHDYSNEPAPNGGRVNLGFYGNTAAAETTPEGSVSITGEVSVAFGGGVSQPIVSFTPGGLYAINTYNVKIEVMENGVVKRTDIVPLNVPSGETFEYAPYVFLATGSAASARVTIVDAGGTSVTDPVTSASVTVTGAPPAWYGKGGDPDTVVHVRPGAEKGANDGTSWTDAYADYRTGLAAFVADATKEELWIAGTNEVSGAATTHSFTRAVAIRGGFTGAENTIGEREAGCKSVIDGQNLYDCLNFQNSATVTVERVCFTRGLNSGMKKTGGAGDLTVEACSFYFNGYAGSWNQNNTYYLGGGGGASLVGTTAATLTVKNSDFTGNGTSGSGSDNGSGAAYIATFKRVYINGCSFVTNYPSGARGGRASALQVYNAPFAVSNCVFRGNKKNCSAGCTVDVTGNCGGSVFANCLFAGNYNTPNTTYGGTGLGVVALALSYASNTVDFANCTLGYNFCTTNRALYVMTGTANIKDSIFYGNIIDTGNPQGADIHVTTGGVANVSYTLFGGSGGGYCTKVETDGSTVVPLELGAGCVFGDAKFVTTTNDFMMLANVKAIPKSTYTLPSFAGLVSFNCHLRGKGYTDETTGGYVELGVKKSSQSPAIDAGDPASDCSREPKPNGRRVNLGAYGNTSWATLSWPASGILIVVR